MRAGPQLRFVIQWLPPALGLIATVLGISNQVGYLAAILLAAVVALVLWIASNRFVKTIPPPTPSQSLTPKTTVSTRTHSVCEVGPYKVESGEVRTILLNINQGQRLKGHLEEIDSQPFEWYIADEKNMVLRKNGDFQKFNPIAGDNDSAAYRVDRKIPWQARWYLILDMYGKQYSRKVRVDFEPVPG